MWYTGWTSNWRQSMYQGSEIHAELHSTDASTGAALTLWDGGSPATGTGAPRVQTATEYLSVSDVILVFTAGGAYSLVFYPLGGSITDTAGLRIAKGTANTNGGLAHHFSVPSIGPQGYGIALIAAAGVVDISVNGTIMGA